MYCPACDKEFSPVHSRCPECKGWLRVSGPTAGSKAAISPAMRAVSTNSTHVDSTATQKVQQMTGAGVTLPSRPNPVAPAASLQDAPVSRPATPAPSLQSNTEPVDTLGGRGALGSGWESSKSFAAPAPATGWGTSAPPVSNGNGSQWGAPPSTLNSWQSPQAEPVRPTGWGTPGGGIPASHPGAMSPGLGGPTASSPGLGGGPPSGSLGAPPGSLPGTAPVGGGWLGDGGGGGSAYSPPARSSGGWLGDSVGSSEPSPLSMPALSHPEIASATDSPVLALPDHTVAVDLGTPWEEEAPTAQSNRMIYLVLACLVLGLVGFSGYVYWQRKKLKEPPKPMTAATTGSLEMGKDYLKQGETAFKNHKYEEAQSKGELAFTLIADLKVAPAPVVQRVKQFHRQATTSYAQSLFDQANRAFQNEQTSPAISLCQQTEEMYRKLPGTEKLRAQAFGLEGRIYQSIGDSAGAMSAYRKAHRLNPSAGYDRLSSQARAEGAPVPVQTVNTTEPTEPVEQPSIGDGSAYPSGRPGGGYRGHAASNPAPPAVPIGPAPKPRPVNTYVPPKRDTTPSWRKKPSDSLPGY